MKAHIIGSPARMNVLTISHLPKNVYFKDAVKIDILETTKNWRSYHANSYKLLLQ